MREEVCAPGEFNLTIPLEAGKRERKATTRKNWSQEMETGEEEEE